jgi:hypothetical protein
LLRLYEALDARLFKGGGEALRLVDVGEEIRRAGIFSLDLGPGGAALAQADVRRVQAADLDVLLDFCPEIGGALPPGCARYGLWSAHQGDSRGPRTAPALFREVLEGDPVSAAEVQVRTGPTGGHHVARRSLAATRFRSLHQTRNTVYWKSGEMLLRCLRDLHARGPDFIPSLEPCPGAAGRSGADGRTPGALRTARFLAGQLGRLLRASAQRLLVRNQWLLAVRPRKPASAGGNGFRLILPPRGHCYADPFLWKRDGKNFVFFEEYRFDRPKGVISCLEIDPSGNPGAPRVALERDYHLSYPFLFEWQGQTYLLPETSANRTVELYRAVEFPHRWVPERVLMRDVTLTDATLVQHGGRFWLFASPQGQAHSVNDELNLYFADSPLGPWRPHPRNPIVADARRARPAGRLLRVNAQLFRPAQDCSVRYGYAVSFQRVDVLTETEYEESCASRLEPCWLPGNLATHTFNHNEDFEAVDAQVERRKYAWLPGWPRRSRPSAEDLSGAVRYGAHAITPLDRTDLAGAAAEAPAATADDLLPAG